MPLLNLILVLAVFGFIVWLVVNYIPMPEPFHKVIIAVVSIVLILWLLQTLGVTGPTIHIGRLP